MLHARYEAGFPFESLLATVEKSRELWLALYKRAVVPSEIAERVRALPGARHLLVLTEDWCGDSINIIPLLARLTEAAPNVDLRLLGREANPDLMDAHLTGTSRSIPAVMVLDERYEECGFWGPRPAPLQRWVMEHGMALPKAERYREVRSWYARDRGATTLAEIAALLERCAVRASGQRPSLGGEPRALAPDERR